MELRRCLARVHPESGGSGCITSAQAQVDPSLHLLQATHHSKVAKQPNQQERGEIIQGIRQVFRPMGFRALERVPEEDPLYEVSNGEMLQQGLQV